MEKVYYYATLFFGTFITLALIIFSIFAFRLGYPVIGIFLVLIVIASIFVYIVFMKKWDKQKQV
ncbi:hypothetical protein [Bacillus chungangensis]|uniref:Magnesium-transporting ATPase (P-type) n=1 Tax=Bacillus chungangensis TaxID=587633 RepID=A0ABT9WTX7_9BACI|nr:hypothetical protein [Bacillus chungangensis]MDQ0176342.1 magnesium-transporting ATPase (P-type) [Bacillus chungangensis]